MDVIDVAEVFQEINEVFFFCEASELRCVVQAHIHDAFNASGNDFAEKFFRVLFRESDGEQLDRVHVSGMGVPPVRFPENRLWF